MKTSIGYRVSADVLGRTKSVVFSTRQSAETFAKNNAHRNPTIEVVELDFDGKIVSK
jgi:hypothetical protein